MRRTPDDFDKKFGTALRLARVKRGLSQVELQLLEKQFHQFVLSRLIFRHTHPPW